jgi:hypothetical protein
MSTEMVRSECDRTCELLDRQRLIVVEGSASLRGRYSPDIRIGGSAHPIRQLPLLEVRTLRRSHGTLTSSMPLITLTSGESPARQRSVSLSSDLAERMQTPVVIVSTGMHRVRYRVNLWSELSFFCSMISSTFDRDDDAIRRITQFLPSDLTYGYGFLKLTLKLLYKPFDAPNKSQEGASDSTSASLIVIR